MRRSRGAGLSPQAWHRLRLVAIMGVAGALAGTAFVRIAYDGYPPQGALIGFTIGALWIGIAGAAERPLRRLPFGAALLARAACLGAVIAFALAFGIFAFGTAEHRRYFSLDSLRWYWSLSDWWIDILFSFAVGLTLTTAISIATLIGPARLGEFLLGRYHRPRREDRVFLFADLAGSTALAERLGELGFHALLQQVMADLNDPIARFRGGIDRYIGDSVVVTWRLADGIADSRALRCALAMHERLEAHAPAYLRRFAVAPELRIGLHAGPVAAGEVGIYRKEILFLGDTVNMTARVEEACRDLGRPLLLTRELRDVLAPPPGWRFEPLGPFHPRGRARPTELFTVEQEG